MSEKPAERKSPLLQIRGLPLQGHNGPSGGVHDLLSREQQLRLQAIASAVEYSQGDNVFFEGDDGQFVYAIGTGAVGIGRHSETGKRQFLALLFPGDLFGLPECGRYVNFAEVLRPSLLYRIPLDLLIELMRADPDVQLAIVTRLTFDLRHTQRRVITLAHQSAWQKLALFLLDLLQHSEFCEGDGLISLPLTMIEVADYLGISPETVTRAFAKLEKTKLIRRISNRVVSIGDLAGLERLIQGRRRSMARA